MNSPAPNSGEFRSRLFPYLLGVLIAVIATVFVVQQPQLQMRGGMVDDERQYLSMARQLAGRELPVEGSFPFVFRLGTPALAAALGTENLSASFLTVNLVFGVLGTIFLFLFLGLFVTRPLTRFLLVLLYVSAPLGPFRFTSLFPTSTDAAATALSLAVMYYSLRKEYSLTAALLTALLCFIGAFFRETVIVAPFAVWLGYLIGRGRPSSGLIRSEHLLRLLPLMAFGCGTFVLARFVSPTVDGSALDHFLQIILWNAQNPLRFAVAALLSWGPIVLLGLGCVRFRSPDKEIREITAIAFGAILVALAFSAGMHTDRHLFWAAIVVYPLVGKYWHHFVERERPTGVQRMAMLLPIGLAQVLSHRLFWSIPHVMVRGAAPDSASVELLLFAPFGARITPAITFASSMPNEFLSLLFLQYAALMLYLLVMVAWIRASRG